jgi:hypothetical protein
LVTVGKQLLVIVKVPLRDPQFMNPDRGPFEIVTTPPLSVPDEQAAPDLTKL